MNTTPADSVFVVDTGSPVNLADSSFFSLPSGLYSRQVETLGLTFIDLPVLFEDWIEDTAPLQGILGVGVLKYFFWELDYPGRRITLYPEGFPTLDPADTPIPFMLRGGGVFRLSNGDTFSVGATRHLIYMTIEGQEVLAMLDTGASYMVASESLLALLGGLDGRPDHGTLEMVTVNGVIEAPLTELSQVAFRDAPDSSSVSDVFVSIMPDAFFNELYLETGKKIDLFIGGSYLRHFRLRFDYDEQVIHASAPSAKKSNIQLPRRARFPLPLEPAP